MHVRKKIGPYTIVFHIKTGKYAETFRVVDEKGNKRFLKLFNLAKLTNSQYEQTIENITEINIVKSLSHINIENILTVEKLFMKVNDVSTWFVILLLARPSLKR